ncbi:MAG: 3'-5' exonuclease [Myxococcales bacterium]|nr:3'-5' exonuclease [Myxococcales bacterium]MCB9530357.1 3'-5' exonuclease [Myxococcales bacterium]
MIDLARPWRECRVVSFDLETTGTDVENDRIIEVGVAIFEGGEVVERWQQLVDPEIEVPEIVTQVTGIKTSDVAGQPVLASVVETMLGYLGQGVLLAYNHEFDTRLLASELRRIGREFELPPCLDPFPFVYEHFREKQVTRNAQLGTICEHLEIPLDAAHRADHDAEAAGRVMFELPNHIVLPDGLGDLLQIQRVLLRQVTEKFNRFRRGREGARNTLGAVDEIIIELGAAYIYGDEADPVRALFSRVPDVRDLG